MFVRINQSCILSFVVKDKNNTVISNDTPYCTIRDKANGKYYNGLTFDDGETKLQMRYVLNGLYTFEFVPEIVSNFEVFCKTDAYDNSISFEVESYDIDGLPEYKWAINTTYTISIPVTENNVQHYCSIMRTSDSKYYSKDGFVDNETNLAMQNANNAVWLYQFTPNEYGEYVITCGSISYKLSVEEGVDNNTVPVMASSASVRFTDGTDTMCLTKNNVPLQGVIVTAYSKLSKEIAGKTATKSDGTWSMLLPAGTYVFVFSKDKYSSVSLERSVS